MNSEYIECGKYYFNNNEYQIMMDSNYKKIFFRIVEKDGLTVYEEVTEEENKELDIIFNKPFTGIIENYEELIEMNKINNLKNKLVISSDVSRGIQTQYIEDFLFFLPTLEGFFLENGLSISMPYYEERAHDVKIRTAGVGELRSSIGGQYNFNANEILLNNPSSLSHELLHMSVARKSKEYGRINGFRMCDFHNYGKGIDEFATQYIAALAFNKRKGYFNQNDHEIIYAFISVIGLNDFLTCYFQTGLFDLIDKLSKYYEKRKIEKLIGTMDTYFNMVENYGIRDTIISLDERRNLDGNLRSIINILNDVRYTQLFNSFSK